MIQRRTNLDQITSAGTAQYSYDARGNLTRVVGGGSNSNFAWDPANRLASYTSSSGNSSLYGYDADGRWTSQTAGGATHSFVWDESTPFGDIAQEVDALGAPIANYSRGGSEMVGKFAGGAASYYLHDALGSVVGLTNSTGAVTDQYRYDAYGNVTSSQGSTVNPYGYRGQRVDAISSLQQLRARWFEPGAGRFLSRDTMDYELDNPVDLNRYGYAAANPINSYDPTGHSDLVEYGIIARETEELAIIEGYLIGRRDEALISCVADVLLAMLAREFLSGGWVGFPNVITVAFGHLVKAPLDAAGKDWMVTRELLLAKAAMFESAPREWTMALSGIRFRIPKVFTDGLNFFVGRLGVRLVSDQQSTPDPCNNHAEQKLLRDANPPLQTLLSVGASRPVCVNCAMQLLPWVDCFGPIGSNMRCVQ